MIRINRLKKEIINEVSDRVHSLVCNGGSIEDVLHGLKMKYPFIQEDVLLQGIQFNWNEVVKERYNAVI